MSSQLECFLPESTTPSEELVEQAAQWHVLIHLGEASTEDEIAFNKWYSLSKHAEAYERFEKIWQRFDPVDSIPAQSALKQVLLKKDGKSKRLPSTRVLTSIGLLLIGLIFSLESSFGERMLSSYLPAYFADYNTSTGEQQLVELRDQTRIYLNTNSAMNVEYTDTQRTIYLLRGEIQLDVASDAERPLVVIGKQGTARALGTQFVVRDYATTTKVMVTESKVEVCTKARSALTQIMHCQELQAGEETQISPYQVELPQAINPAFKRDWAQQLLIVDNQPLLNVLDELSRYQSGYIRMDRDALTSITVSGVFPLDDINRALQVLESSLPINVKSYTSMLTVIGAQASN